MAEAFDTLTAAEKLQNGGLSDDQSKAIAHVIGDAITGNVATKSDIELLKNEIKDLENRLKLWMFKALGTVAAVIVVITKLLDYVFDKVPL
jgi:hypothetical protein